MGAEFAPQLNSTQLNSTRFEALAAGNESPRRAGKNLRSPLRSRTSGCLSKHFRGHVEKFRNHVTQETSQGKHVFHSRQEAKRTEGKERKMHIHMGASSLWNRIR